MKTRIKHFKNERNQIFFRAALFPVLLWGTLLLAGCSSSLTESASGDLMSQAEMETIREQAYQIQREAEAHLHRLNEQIPGFGGMYIREDGSYAVFLNNDAEQSSARTIITGDVQAKSQGLHSRGKPEVVFARGTYTFRDLAAWRELVTAFMLAGPQWDFVISNQVDESSNRVVIGIDANRYDKGLLSRAGHFIEKTLGIPIDAVKFIPEFPETDEYDSCTETLSGDIGDRQRPLVGGLRIRYGSSSRCTLGFMGVYDGQEVFVTNSHCTDDPYSTSSTVYFQGQRNNNNDKAGTEFLDMLPTLDACVVPNSYGWPCRWSDAALVSIEPGVARERGAIAKTDEESENWMEEGSTTIDEDSPVFTIWDTYMEIVQGMRVHKVGGNSGWTSGEVTETCVDSRRSSHELVLQCQYRARYATSGGGTSGSPVFVRLDEDGCHPENPVALVGIHRASSNRDQPDGYSAFSPISGVLNDYQNLHCLEKKE